MGFRPYTFIEALKYCRFQGAFLPVVLLFLASFFLPLYAMADTQAVSLKQLDVEDVIYLPTVRSQRVIPFTVPKSWTVKSGSVLETRFQHSDALIPGSWLKIMVNDKVLKHIPLTHDNASQTTIKLPLPVGSLKEFNTLTYRVEQHYTHHCEDPVEASLWTQVLPESKLVFHFDKKNLTPDLAVFPYPVIDPTAYGGSRLAYGVSKTPSEKELMAMAYVNLYLGQFAGQRHEVQTRLVQTKTSSFPLNPNENLILVGTPESLPGIKAYQGKVKGYSLKNNQWVYDKDKKPLADGDGLVLLINHPHHKGQWITLVTGNTPEGVFQAARYLTTLPKDPEMKGAMAFVGQPWMPNSVEATVPPQYIENETRTIAQLGYDTTTVQKINAPPIVMDVPVVTRFRETDAQLNLDVVYSYSPKLNPQFSSLEILMNDRSVANVPLTDPQGETSQEASIPVPVELIQPHNKVVAQFHLFSDKHGRCVDTYKDETWGTLHKDTAFVVQGQPASLLPNVGLLNKTGFPYTRRNNFETTHIALPQSPSQQVLETLLATTTRLGRSTKGETDIRFTLSLGSSQTDSPQAKNKNLLVLSSLLDSAAANALGIISLEGMSEEEKTGPFELGWKQGTVTTLKRLFKQPGQYKASLEDIGTAGYLVQQAAGDKVKTYLVGQTANAFLSLDTLFETDVAFQKLSDGGIKQIFGKDARMNTVLPSFDAGKGGSTPWGWIILGGLLLVACALVATRFFLR